MQPGTGTSLQQYRLVEKLGEGGKGLVSVPVDPGPPLSLGSPRELFSLDELGLVAWPGGFDVDGSGQRFLMVREPGAGPPQSALIVVQDWPAEFPGKP